MVLPGGLLVLLTWAAIVSLVVLLGLPFTVTSRRPVTLRHVAAASWWGVLVIAILGTALAFFVPLSSRGTRITILVAGLCAVVITAIRWKGKRLRRVQITRPTWLWIIGSAMAVGYLAIATLGPVTHYDAGLYQWAAGRYAAEYSVIPGLANLYAPLGYGSIQPVFEGLLASSPWRVNGLRLVNGAFLVLLSLETLSRLATKPRAAGTAVALVGSAITFVPMVWMADFWVASPTPDVPVLVLGIAAAAYWTDFVLGQPEAGRHLPGNAGANLAVIPLIALAQVMDQQGQQHQPPTAADLTPDIPQPAAVGIEIGRLFDGQQAVFINGVLVKVVEL